MDDTNRKKNGFPVPIAAAACWWVTLFLILAALTIEGMATSPARLRMVVVAAAAVVLACGFFLVYARKQAPGSYVGLRRFNAVMIWIVSVGLAMFALIPRGGTVEEAVSPAAALPEVVSPTAGISVAPGVSEAQLAAANKKRLTVKGMVCQSCVETVTEALLDVPGVLAADVDLEDGSARVSSDPCKSPSDSMLVSAIIQAGYKAWPTAEDEHLLDEKGKGKK
jgi:copper chaperone CopZ